MQADGLTSTCILDAEQFLRDHFVQSVSTNFVIWSSFRLPAYILKMNIVQVGKCFN